MSYEDEDESDHIEGPDVSKLKTFDDIFGRICNKKKGRLFTEVIKCLKDL